MVTSISPVTIDNVTASCHGPNCIPRTVPWHLLRLHVVLAWVYSLINSHRRKQHDGSAEALHITYGYPVLLNHILDGPDTETSCQCYARTNPQGATVPDTSMSAGKLHFSGLSN